MKKQKLVIGNWKRPTIKETEVLARKVKEKFSGFTEAEVVVCPNNLSILEVSKILVGSPIKVGAQNAYWEEKNPCTGETPPSMLLEANCSYVILGHHERRRVFKETDEMVRDKLLSVLRVRDIVPIICIGETWEELKSGRRDYVLLEQIQHILSDIQINPTHKIVVNYSPIWAIGTGNVINPIEAEEAVQVVKINLREVFGYKVVSENFQVIYGGSINSDNVRDFVEQEDIDGVLVGGASVDADELYKIASLISK
jgi:triosephosphate isomerase (TIM)